MLEGRLYLLRIYDDGEIVEFRMHAPDDESALDNAQKGFNRMFKFSGIDEELGIKILEEKINE